MSTLKIRLGRVKGSIWYTGTADSNTAIATALTPAGYTPIKLDMYMNTSNGNVYQYLPLDDGLQWVLQGNLRGTKGEGFEIKKTYSSVAEMNKSYDIDDVPLYGFVLINTGNVEDEENARLYVKGDATYQFLTDLSGAQGIRGEKGEKGDIGPEGLQGRGYYRANVKIDVSATTTSRANINPTNCRLLISDTIVDNVGNYFAVTANCEIGDATIKIAHRGYIGGKDGVDGLGVPSGGSTGQVLTKLSDADYDTVWQDLSGGAGGMSVDVTQYIDADKKVIGIPAALMGILAEKYTQGSPVVLRATYSYLGIDTLFIYTMCAMSKISGEGITLYTAVFSETKYSPDCFEAPVFVATSGTIEQYEIALYDNTTSKSRYGAVQIAFDNAYRAIALKAKQDAQGNDIAATYYKKPVNGIPETDLSEEVLNKLESGGGNTEQLTFGNATWDQIGRIAEAGESRKYFNIGDEKTIELSTGEKITLVILGFDHDDLTTGGKAGITIGIKNILSILYPMNNSATNEGGWCESKMRTETMQMLLFQLPSDLRAIIKDVYKYELKNSYGNNVVDSITTQSTLFLFARVEIIGQSEETRYWCEGEQYEYWRSVKNGEISKDRIKSDQSWWLRTWYSDTESNETFFAVTNEGNFELKNANTNCGVSFGFCIGNQSSDKYYSKPESGIPESDLNADVQAKLNSGGSSVKQISVSSGETIYSVVDKITSAIEEELTAQSRSSAVVTVALNGLTISDAVMSGGAAGRVFLETSYMSATSGVSQNKIVFITPLVRALGDSTSVWGNGSWAVTVQFGKFESNIIASTGMAVGGGADFKDLANFVSNIDTTIDLIFY